MSNTVIYTGYGSTFTQFSKLSKHDTGRLLPSSQMDSQDSGSGSDFVAAVSGSKESTARTTSASVTMATESGMQPANGDFRTLPLRNRESTAVAAHSIAAPTDDPDRYPFTSTTTTDCMPATRMDLQDSFSYFVAPAIGSGESTARTTFTSATVVTGSGMQTVEGDYRTLPVRNRESIAATEHAIDAPKGDSGEHSFTSAPISSVPAEHPNCTPDKVLDVSSAVEPGVVSSRRAKRSFSATFTTETTPVESGEESAHHSPDTRTDYRKVFGSPAPVPTAADRWRQEPVERWSPDDEAAMLKMHREDRVQRQREKPSMSLFADRPHLDPEFEKRQQAKVQEIALRREKQRAYREERRRQGKPYSKSGSCAAPLSPLNISFPQRPPSGPNDAATQDDAVKAAEMKLDDALDAFFGLRKDIEPSLDNSTGELLLTTADAKVYRTGSYA